jgi:hypothetical protein
MKALVTLVMILGIYLLGKSIYKEAKVKQAKEETAAKGTPAGPADGLEGMPPQFEGPYQAALAQGAPAVKAWIDRYRPYIRDPKLASIELDYVVLVSRSNPQEAQRVFQSVKARVAPNSPVYQRVRKLEPTYGR